MFSRAGRTLTQIGGRHSPGMNLCATVSSISTTFTSMDTSSGARWRAGLPTRVEEDEPGSYGEEREEELARYGEDEREEQQRRHRRLDHGAGRLDDAQREDAEDGQDEILAVINRPPMGLERS